MYNVRHIRNAKGHEINEHVWEETREEEGKIGGKKLGRWRAKKKKKIEKNKIPIPPPQSFNHLP